MYFFLSHCGHGAPGHFGEDIGEGNFMHLERKGDIYLHQLNIPSASCGEGMG
jgi:hypothetical protein